MYPDDIKKMPALNPELFAVLLAVKNQSVRIDPQNWTSMTGNPKPQVLSSAAENVESESAHLSTGSTILPSNGQSYVSSPWQPV